MLSQRFHKEFFQIFLQKFIKKAPNPPKNYSMILPSFSLGPPQDSRSEHLQEFNQYFLKGFSKISYKIVVPDFITISIRSAFVRIPSGITPKIPPKISSQILSELCWVTSSIVIFAGISPGKDQDFCLEINGDFLIRAVFQEKQSLSNIW